MFPFHFNFFALTFLISPFILSLNDGQGLLDLNLSTTNRCPTFASCESCLSFSSDTNPCAYCTSSLGADSIGLCLRPTGLPSIGCSQLNAFFIIEKSGCPPPESISHCLTINNASSCLEDPFCGFCDDALFPVLFRGCFPSRFPFVCEFGFQGLWNYSVNFNGTSLFDVQHRCSQRKSCQSCLEPLQDDAVGGFRGDNNNSCFWCSKISDPSFGLCLADGDPFNNGICSRSLEKIKRPMQIKTASSSTTMCPTGNDMGGSIVLPFDSMMSLCLNLSYDECLNDSKCGFCNWENLGRGSQCMYGKYQTECNQLSGVWESLRVNPDSSSRSSVPAELRPPFVSFSIGPRSIQLWLALIGSYLAVSVFVSGLLFYIRWKWVTSSRNRKSLATVPNRSDAQNRNSNRRESVRSSSPSEKIRRSSRYSNSSKETQQMQRIESSSFLAVPQQIPATFSPSLTQLSLSPMGFSEEKSERVVSTSTRSPLTSMAEYAPPGGEDMVLENEGGTVVGTLVGIAGTETEE